VRSHNDIRLHHELRTSCAADTKTLCSDVEPGEGRVIKCLRDARQTITHPNCRAVRPKQETRYCIMVALY
jgi:hypothetical protein